MVNKIGADSHAKSYKKHLTLMFIFGSISAVCLMSLPLHLTVKNEYKLPKEIPKKHLKAAKT